MAATAMNGKTVYRYLAVIVNHHFYFTQDPPEKPLRCAVHFPTVTYHACVTDQ